MNKIITPAWDAEVKLKELKVDERLVPGKLAVVPREPLPGGEKPIISVISDKYRFVSNVEADEAALAILTEAFKQVEPREVVWDGKRFRRRYVIYDLWSYVPGKHDLPSKPPNLQLGLDVINSYDGSCKCSIRLILVEVVDGLSVGYISPESELVSYEIRHFRQDDSDDWISNQSQIAEVLATNATKILALLMERIKNLHRQPMSIGRLWEIAKTARFPLPRIWHIITRVSDGLHYPGRAWPDGQDLAPWRVGEPSLWEVYQAIAWYLSSCNNLADDRTSARVGDYFLSADEETDWIPGSARRKLADDALEAAQSLNLTITGPGAEQTPPGDPGDDSQALL